MSKAFPNTDIRSKILRDDFMCTAVTTVHEAFSQPGVRRVKRAGVELAAQRLQDAFAPQQLRHSEPIYAVCERNETRQEK